MQVLQSLDPTVLLIGYGNMFECYWKHVIPKCCSYPGRLHGERSLGVSRK